MTLASGTRLGPFEVLDALGAGGMGEVYRARDTRLKGDVALKVLEAHGIEEGSIPCLVLELVEGPTLADSPAMTSPAQMTRAGVILSTAACMAPEQARSKKRGQP